MGPRVLIHQSPLRNSIDNSMHLEKFLDQLFGVVGTVGEAGRYRNRRRYSSRFHLARRARAVIAAESPYTSWVDSHICLQFGVPPSRD